jgi:L-fucose isomerase-like protein
MTEVSFDEFSMRKVFGPAVERLSLDGFLRRRDTQDDARADEVWRGFKARAGKVGVSDEDGVRSAKAYLALKGWADEHALAGLAFECYPDYMGEVCLAYSLLADDGIVAACEGDMNSALATLILYWLSGEPVHNTDLLTHFEADNSILLSHCGSGSLGIADSAENIHLAPVRLAHKGVCVLFPGRPGKVTLVNLVGREGTYRTTAFSGEAVRTGMDFAGNPLRVVCPINVIGLMYRLAEIGAGHHWMICYGDVLGELEALAGLVGVRFVRS